MKKNIVRIKVEGGRAVSVPVVRVHTLVVGSGAAGLNAAVQLRRNGVDDVLIVSEGLKMGASINTGSDKQTYYKLAMCAADEDSPAALAETFFGGGSMHGDLALAESAVSARAFFNLVNLGVPFPRDAFGQFMGYKTDHDPRRRATSIGPYTSREMCRVLIREVERLGIPVREGRNAVRLAVCREGGRACVAGVAALDGKGRLELYRCANMIFAVGGPGGIYKSSVYPRVHTGAIGLALMEGAAARNLTESQYGLASIKFRWNVSGTYMQVIPRVISTAADGSSDEREFMRDYFENAGSMNSFVFLKGYQWPFDSRKAAGGSSLVDILVYIETVERGRRVFLDYRRNPEGFRFDDLGAEAREYLAKSQALLDLPIDRLRKMNPGAVELYREHGIDLGTEPLEIAVCAQHNNGGLAANHWWESENVRGLFPVGEVNGSHGVYRPGGSALNSGQVGGFRAAEFIANRRRCAGVAGGKADKAALRAAKETLEWMSRCRLAETDWKTERAEFQARMSRAGAHIRSATEARKAAAEAWEQYSRIENRGCAGKGARGIAEAARNRHLCFAHAVYLDAIRFALESGVGSRGSAIAIAPENGTGTRVHDRLPGKWKILPEDETRRNMVLETVARGPAEVEHRWTPRRPLPVTDEWFETAWARFRNGEIYGEES